jgi:flagellar motor switch protein FliN/FliY
MRDDQLAALSLLPIEIEGQLDRKRISMLEILSLEPGSLLRLDRSAGENIDIVAGGNLLGFGEIVIVEDMACIRVTDFREEL